MTPEAKMHADLLQETLRNIYKQLADIQNSVATARQQLALLEKACTE